MNTTLPTLEKIAIKQSTTKASERRIDTLPQLLLIVPKTKRAHVADSVPYADALNTRLSRGGWSKTPSHAVVELPNERATRVVVGFVDKEVDAFARQAAARKLVAAARFESATAMTVLIDGVQGASAWAEAVVLAAGAASFELANFKQKKTPRKPLKQIEFLALPARHDFAHTLAAVHGNNLARWLSALPPNALTPAKYRRYIAQLAKRYGWQVETMGEVALAKKGCGAFLAVVQGSPDRDAALVRVKYRPKKSTQRTLALVGKGLCYDTGGVNVKPARYMFGMHEDMLGSSVALGTLLALTELEAPFAVDCWLALAQNHIGPDAYKPNDVVTACDGTTIEVVHTDAEGRMVLADTLALVRKSKPALAIDFATLTGSCVAALGTRYSGVFTNDDALHEPLIAAGKASGERVWPFPQDADYDKALDSDVADIKQCSLENDADHILAARFLSRFIGKDVPWVHVDLSAGNTKGGLGAVPTESTGFGVRFTLEALLGPRSILSAK
ncbi:MAG: leucyl aminopeptidase family protein [Gammaproteobacteria bacterium]